MPTFALRPNSKFSTNLSQAVGDTTTTTWNVNSIPGRIPCVLIIDPGLATQEKVKVTGSGTGTITVVRNFDGKGAFQHGFNATIVDYDAPEYITTIADLLEQNFNTDYTPQSSVFTRQDFATQFPNFVASGLTIPTSGTLTTTSTSGVVYFNGTRYAVASDGGHTYTASKDTYVDVNPVTGAYTYNAVANGAAAPALTANSIRIAKVVSGAGSVTGVTQSGFDSLGNPIYYTKPYGNIANPNIYRARAYLNANQLNVATATATKVLLDTIDYDTNNNFDVTTNHRWTSPVTGYYLITGSIASKDTEGVSGTRWITEIFKNGSVIKYSAAYHAGTSGVVVVNSDIFLLNATDYIELFLYHEAGANKTIQSSSPDTSLAIHLLSI